MDEFAFVSKKTSTNPSPVTTSFIATFNMTGTDKLPLVAIIAEPEPAQQGGIRQYETMYSPYGVPRANHIRRCIEHPASMFA